MHMKRSAKCQVTLLSAIAWIFSLSEASISLIPLDSEVENEWTTYKLIHKKAYLPREDAVRLMLFLLTDGVIRVHNNRNLSFTLTHNQFSDLTRNERNEYFGLKFLDGSDMPTTSNSSTYEGSNNTTRSVLPDSLDYRDDPCVGPVKNQRRCGSCWAFAAVAPLEFSYCKKNGNKYVALSEQQLVDCDPYNHGCSGGWPDRALDYMSLRPVQTRASYPYVSLRLRCKYNPNAAKVRVASYGYAARRDAEAMKEALVQHGPLSVTVYADFLFQQYRFGVFASFGCQLLRFRPNHAVVIVGYGTLLGLPYWIVRNQWGLTWGFFGYMKILRGFNMCGIEANPIYVEAALIDSSTP